MMRAECRIDAGFLTSPTTETFCVAYSAMKTVTWGSLRNPPSMNFWRMRCLRLLRFHAGDVQVIPPAAENVAGIADAKFAAELWSVEDAHLQEIASANRAGGAAAKATAAAKPATADSSGRS